MPVRRPATAAGPPSPRPSVSLNVVGNAAGGREAPRIVLRRDQGAGTRWTSEVREEAERVVALVEGGCHRSAVTGALLIYFIAKPLNSQENILQDDINLKSHLTGARTKSPSSWTYPWVALT